MAAVVPPLAVQIVGAVLVFVGAIVALGTLAADHAYWRHRCDSGHRRIPTSWLLMPIDERIGHLREKQGDARGERLRRRAGRWWMTTGVVLAVALLYFGFVPAMVGG